MQLVLLNSRKNFKLGGCKPYLIIVKKAFQLLIIPFKP